MKKRIAIALFVVILVVCSVMLTSAGSYNSKFVTLGQEFKNSITNSLLDNNAALAAKCGDYQIPMSVVEYEKKIAKVDATSNQQFISDREITESLVKNVLLLIEAESVGIVATQAEKDAFVRSVKYSYELPDGKKLIDDYCTGAGITTEEYFKIIEDRAETVVVRQKLKDYYAQQYCEKSGIEFTKVNPPAEMEEYVDAQLDKLLEKYADIIEIYVD